MKPERRSTDNKILELIGDRRRKLRIDVRYADQANDMRVRRIVYATTTTI